MVNDSSGVLLIGESVGTDTTLCLKTFDLTTTTVEAAAGSLLAAVATGLLGMATDCIVGAAELLLVVVSSAGIGVPLSSAPLSERDTISASCLLELTEAGGSCSSRCVGRKV